MLKYSLTALACRSREAGPELSGKPIRALQSQLQADGGGRSVWDTPGSYVASMPWTLLLRLISSRGSEKYLHRLVLRVTVVSQTNRENKRRVVNGMLFYHLSVKPECVAVYLLPSRVQLPTACSPHGSKPRQLLAGAYQVCPSF